MRLVMGCVLIVYGCLGCTPEERCGAEYEYENGVCVLLDDSDDTAETGTDSAEALGRVCTLGAQECDATAGTCVIKPGASEGYCAPSDCDPVTNDCPDGYSCCSMQSGATIYCMLTADFEILIGMGLCGE